MISQLHTIDIMGNKQGKNGGCHDGRRGAVFNYFGQSAKKVRQNSKLTLKIGSRDLKKEPFYSKQGTVSLASAQMRKLNLADVTGLMNIAILVTSYDGRCLMNNRFVGRSCDDERLMLDAKVDEYTMVTGLMKIAKLVNRHDKEWLFQAKKLRSVGQVMTLPKVCRPSLSEPGNLNADKKGGDL